MAERLARELTAPTTLTERQLECLALVALGFNRREIGERLHLSYWTVATHLGYAKDKLGARTLAHAVAIALTTGVLPVEYVKD